MPIRWSRLWFSATVVCVAGGVLLSILTAANTTTGHFRTPTERAFNTLSFFTVQSNLLVGVGALALAARRPRTSTAFATLRLIGVVAITVTGTVYHVVLSQLFDLQGWDRLGDQLVHTVVPVLAVAGWLAFGPRGLVTARVVWWSLIFPLAWLAFTLVRGAFVHWYPYPFIDVTRLGYGGALLNCFWVALLLLGLAAGAGVVDRRLARSRVAQEAFADHSPVRSK